MFTISFVCACVLFVCFFCILCVISKFFFFSFICSSTIRPTFMYTALSTVYHVVQANCGPDQIFIPHSTLSVLDNKSKRCARCMPCVMRVCMFVWHRYIFSCTTGLSFLFPSFFFFWYMHISTLHSSIFCFSIIPSLFTGPIRYGSP